MSLSTLTTTQRRIVTLLLIAVVVALAMLAGFVVTSLQISSRPVPTVTPTATLTPSPTPAPTATAAPPPPIAGIWPQVQAARLFDQIARQVEAVRGLSPRAEVPLSFLDERDMLSLRRQLYAARDYTDPLFPYIALGLLPDTAPTPRPRPAVGMYVPEQEQLYVSLDVDADATDDRLVLAHTYLHALQDRYFDLEALDARATTGDSRLAVHALVEGDGLLTTALYAYDDLAAADWEHLTDLIVQAEQPDYGEQFDAAPAWPRLQRFPYRQGRDFAAALFAAGGWETVNGAYTDPPRSTEQVLHPERYLGDERDVPAAVTIPSLGTALGGDWEMAWRDTLGEFVAGLYLATGLPEDEALAAAAGWGGDTVVIWEDADGRRLLVWRTLWDTRADAEEFAAAMATLVQRRYLPVQPLSPPNGLGGRWWEWDGGSLYLARVGRYVTYAQAPDTALLTAVVEELP